MESDLLQSDPLTACEQKTNRRDRSRSGIALPALKGRRKSGRVVVVGNIAN